MLKDRGLRDPVLYLVDEYFKNKQLVRKQREQQNSNKSSSNVDTIPLNRSLPEYPVLFVQNEEGIYVRAIYGNLEYLGENVEVDTCIWQEEFIYDAWGTCVGIKTTYPDGSEYTKNIIRDVNAGNTQIK